MASSKDTHPSTRPLIYHRPALAAVAAATAASAPSRQSHARTNSHSLVAGPLNAGHRVTRRKSVTNPGPNMAALTAAVNGASEQSSALPIVGAARRQALSKARVGSLPSPPASLPIHKIADVKESAIEDEVLEGSGDDELVKSPGTRARRASDGQSSVKDALTKRSNRVEVRCEKCGKGYKHSSCLTKHLWEHTPEWSYTSKLLISKHQQVQLLEAASVLVAMNGKENSATPPDSAKDSASEPDSATSPAASGYSEQAEWQSSADTTPPPTIEGLKFDASPYHDDPWHHTAELRSASPRSSKPFGLGGFFDSLVANQSAHDFRPASSGANKTGKDDQDLAAAVELLSCSFSSNKGSQATLTLLADAPPVPPLPTRYLDQAASLSSAGFVNSFPSRQPESFTRGELRRESVDVKMEDSGEDDDFDMLSRARSDEDDDGVFGRMEE